MSPSQSQKATMKIKKLTLCTRGGGPIAVGLEPICRQSKGHSVPAHGTWLALKEQHWLHALDPSLVEESSQHGQHCLPGLVTSNMFTLRELLSGLACEVLSVSSPQLFSYSILISDCVKYAAQLTTTASFATPTIGKIIQNMDELRVNTAQFIPRRNFSLGHHSMGKPEHQKNKPCTPDLVLKVIVKQVQKLNVTFCIYHNSFLEHTFLYPVLSEIVCFEK